MKRLAAIVLCALLAAPAAAQQTSEPANASIACFFVLLETSYRQTSQCGRVYSGDESLRFQRVYRRLETYVLERGAPLAERALQTLRGQVGRTVMECSGESLQLANRFVDEVVNDTGFPARLEETLGRDPNPLDGGCL